MIGTPKYKCRHCESLQTVRFGHSEGRQRYRCKRCRRITHEGAQGPQRRTPPDVINRFFDLVHSTSIRAAARAVGISKGTARSLYWERRSQAILQVTTLKT